MNINMRGETAEILLYENIGGMFGVTADMFIREVKSLTNATTINLRLNSDGGNVFDGLSIYNYLKSQPKRVVVDIDGVAASIASIVALAGDEINIAENAWMMIHDPWLVTRGTSEDLRKTAETMDGIRDTLLDTYMKRSKVDREEVSSMMAEETWLNADRALELGFVDYVTESLSIAACVNPEFFQNIPEELKARAEEPKVPKNTKIELFKAKREQVLRQRNLTA